MIPPVDTCASPFSQSLACLSCQCRNASDAMLNPSQIHSAPMPTADKTAWIAGCIPVQYATARMGMNGPWHAICLLHVDGGFGWMCVNVSKPCFYTALVQIHAAESPLNEVRCASCPAIYHHRRRMSFPPKKARRILAYGDLTPC
jgi:hypothetical protein